ncbi:MAG TPA: peroxidase [Fuerstia sp.]|nr:peroxidase [Fuerstiella sp.]
MSHAQDFGRESGNDRVAQQLVYDYRTAELRREDRKLCDYAVKLTLTPGQVNETDVAVLRKAGFTDQQITVAAQVIGYFNYINRIADGLGVDPQDGMQPSVEDWRAAKGRDYGVSR